MLSTEQFAKLPKWAQREFTKLQRENKDLTDRIEDILGEEESRIFIEHDFRGTHTQYIPNDERVRFELDEGQVQVYFANRGRTLTIQGESSLVAYSQSSNTIRIGMMSREQERDLQ